MSGIKFTRKESRVLIDLLGDLNNTGFASKNLKVLQKKVSRFEDDRTKDCLYCGSKFVSTRMSKIYCSRRCKNKANYIKRTSVNLPDYMEEE